MLSSSLIVYGAIQAVSTLNRKVDWNIAVPTSVSMDLYVDNVLVVPQNFTFNITGALPGSLAVNSTISLYNRGNVNMTASAIVTKPQNWNVVWAIPSTPITVGQWLNSTIQVYVPADAVPGAYQIGLAFTFAEA
jgi:uncharacterized membrane protein